MKKKTIEAPSVENEIIAMEEQIANYTQEVMAMQIDLMRRRGSKDNPVSKQEEELLAAKQRDLNEISKTYTIAKKMGFVSGKSLKTPQEFSAGVLNRVKQMTGTMGTIVRDYSKE